MTESWLVQHMVEFRLIERGILTLCVVFTCGWLAFKYVRQTMHVEVAGIPTSPWKLSFAIGTPVLIALLFVGYCYVDLSNPVEIGRIQEKNSRLKSNTATVPATSTQEQPTSESQFIFKGYTDLDQDTKTPSPIDATTERRALEERARLDFALWIKHNLRQIFTTLANLPNQKKVSYDRILTLSLAIGCLNLETFPAYRNADYFTAHKTFDQVESMVHYNISNKTFSTEFCAGLKLER